MEKLRNIITNGIKNIFKSRQFRKSIFAIFIGAVSGFLYYRFIGCSSGQCPITGSPYGSIILGSLIGFFISNSPCSKGKC